MRILLVTPYDGRPGIKATNAVAPYSKIFASHMRSRVQLTVCADGDEPTIFHEEERVRVERMPLTGLRGFLHMIRCVARTRPDAIHVQHEMFLYGGIGAILLFPLVIAIIRLFAPVVITLHHTISQQNIRGDFQTTYHTRIPLLLLRLGFFYFYGALRLAGANAIVHDAVSFGTLTRQYGFPLRRVYVIPYGQSLSLSPASHADLCREFGIPKNARTVFGFFGYIDPRKRIDYLIEEFQAFSKEHPDCVLLIAGSVHPRLSSDARYKTYIERLRAMADGCDNVLWYGELSPEQVPRFFQCVDCIVLPYASKHGGSSILSQAIGADKPFLISEQLKALAGDETMVFTMEPGSLTKTFKAFLEQDLHAESQTQSNIDSLKEASSWAKVIEATVRLYGDMTRKRADRGILVVGAYGQGNLGDELLLRQCLDRLGRERCTVVSADPSGTALRHDVRTTGRNEYARLAIEIARSHAVVVGGGDQFKLLKSWTRRWRLSLLAQGWILSRLCLLLHTPLSFLGVGIGNVYTRSATWLTSSTLRAASVITFREAQSAAWCAEHARGAKAHLSSDLCFLSLPEKANGRADRTIGIAPAFGLDRPSAYRPMVTTFADAADRTLQESAAGTIVLLPFQQTPDVQNDRQVCREIISHMRSKERRSIVPLSMENCDATIGSLHTMWAVRLHSLILACLHAVPFIALVYDEKIRHFLRDIDCERWGIELTEDFSPQQLLALHRELLANHDAVRRHLAEQRDRLHERARVNADLLQNIRRT